jgi:general secretion pathway protein D
MQALRGRGAVRRVPQWRVLACAAAGLLLAGCAAEYIRNDAQSQLADGQFEKAVARLEDGLKDHPNSPVLRAGLVQARNEALARLLAEAAASRSAGRLDEAEQALQRARLFDTGGKRVDGLLQELAIERRQHKALLEAQALADKRQNAAALRVIASALKDAPRHSELMALQRRLEADARLAQMRASQLGLKETRPISLDFRDANLRTVLDLVTRHSGINFVLDKDIRSDIRVSVFLRSARVEDAIDLLVSTHQLAKKVVDAQTILIYPNTPEKHREHQEQVVKVFYLASAEAKNAAAFLRSMLKIREPFVDERANLLAIRESPDNVALAERLMALYDANEPEVLLQVEVIEVRSSRLTELGVKLPDSFSLTPLAPAGAAGLTLANVQGINSGRIGLSVAGLLFNLKREVGDFNTLANPSIRARNREKARVMVGDKIPVITTTTGTGNFVSDNVSYLDVGLKLEVEPTVHADDEVAIRVALEVSSLGQQVSTRSGTIAYQIGTRNAATLLRLRDGETQLLAGLISREDRTAASRVPGIGDLPVLGRLFASQRDEGARTELVLAITPRVLRNLRRPDASETELWVGTETLQRLRPPGGMLPAPEAAAATQAEASAEAGKAPAAALPPAAGARPTLEVPPAVGPAGQAAQVSWTGPGEAKVGDTITASLQINTPVALRGSPVKLHFAPKGSLQLVAVDEGDFFKQGGAATSFTHAVSDAGVNVGVMRNDLSAAVGQGRVLSLRLKAMAPGAAEVSVVGLEPIAIKDAAPAIALPQTLRIRVTP